MEKPYRPHPVQHDWDFDLYILKRKDYEKHFAEIELRPLIPIAKQYSDHWKVGDSVSEDEFEELIVCPLCGGDGKETCSNPDHGFIDAMSFHDIGRLGCPVCGHDEKHKVKNGGSCDVCGGIGIITDDEFEKFCNEYYFNKEPTFIAIPKPKEDERELWRILTSDLQAAVEKDLRDKGHSSADTLDAIASAIQQLSQQFSITKKQLP